MYLTAGWLGFSGSKFYEKWKLWLSRNGEFENEKGKQIPRKDLPAELREYKDRWYHPNPPIGAMAGVKTIITPTWMHGIIHSMVLINVLMMLLIDRKSTEWGNIVNALKQQYNYLENGDIVTCGDEVAQFANKFREFYVSVSPSSFFFIVFMLFVAFVVFFAKCNQTR